MKSYFILFILTSFFQVKALAQMSTRPSPKEIAELRKSSFQKFSDRLRIGYFGVFTSPTIYDMERQNWDYAATSSPYQTFSTHRDSVATNFLNQVNFSYNFGAKLNFVFIPRFSLWPIEPHSPNQNAENSLIPVEDFLVGFQGVSFTSADKAFNLWIRPGVRLPTSRATRRAFDKDFGSITHQLELAYSPTYDFNKTWQLGLFGQFRQWTFDDRYNYSRFRFYQAPYVQYAFNDTNRIQWYWETIVENSRRWKSIGKHQEPEFRNYYQNTFVGLSHDINAKFNIFPFLGCILDRRIDEKSLWVGAWISYQIK
jgi:hypothetical protein